MSTISTSIRSNSTSNDFRIALIVSDHGFGHAGRVCAVVPHLLAAGVHLLVISGVPLSFFIESLVDPRAEAHWRASHRAADDAALLRDLLPTLHFAHLQTDVGVRQADAIRIDAAATAAALARFYADFDATVARIESLVRDFNARAIVFDISSLAPAVARRLALPAIGVSNFDWAFIYDSMVHLDPVFATYAQRHRDAYRHATHLVVLPAATPMSAFDHARQLRLPGWTGRRSTMTRTDARRILGMLDGEQRYLVLTFGGHVQPTVARSSTAAWRIVTIDPSPLRADEAASDATTVVRQGDGAVTLRLAALRALHDVRFVDIIAAADVVVTKPGYGTVSELILNQVPSLWVSRPGFAEEPFLAAELASHTVTEQIDSEHVLSAGNALFSAAQRVFDMHQRQGARTVQQHNGTLAQQILQWVEQPVH